MDTQIKRRNDLRLVRQELKSVTKRVRDRENKIINASDAAARDELATTIKSEISRVYQSELLSGKITLDSDICQKIRQYIINYLNENNYVFNPIDSQAEFINEFIINFSGYGVLQPLIDDETIEEIYVLGYNKIYINRTGKRILTDISFRNKEHLKTFLDNILAMINRRVDYMQPIEDAHLPDYNRVAVSGDAISPQGFTFNIRKFRKEKFTLDSLVENRTMNEEVKDVLKKVIYSKLNYLISGGTSSGKTTLLNALADYFSPQDFVISIEDNLELQLGHEFCLQLETRKPNIEGKGEITMAEEFKHCLRRSPGRFIIGEIRDGAVANTFITACNTGHDGCCATVHSNSPEMCRSRISKLISNETGTDIGNCESDFNQAINCIVQISFLPLEYRRVITNVTFVTYEGELFDWVTYDRHNDDWIINHDFPAELEERLETYGLSKTYKPQA